MIGEGGLQYSIVKTDDSYVIRVGGQDFLKVTSRRRAARLISDVHRRSGMAGDHEAARDESDESDDASRLCLQQAE